jgi:hypothetical protein
LIITFKTLHYLLLNELLQKGFSMAFKRGQRGQKLKKPKGSNFEILL